MAGASLLILAGLFLAATGALAQPPGAPGARMSSGPLQVGVVTVEEQAVPYTVTVPGRAVAYAQVNIRPRVGGVVSEIAYTPGRPVAVDDLLYRIDDDTYAAAVSSAEAEVESTQAELTGAEDTLTRYRQIEDVGVTRAEVEAADVAVAKARAAVSTAEAALEVAELELDMTEIKSPIEGVTAVSTVSVGDIVTANQTDALTTVTRLDPIYVDVEESSARIMRIRQEIDKGVLQPGDQVEMRLTLEDGTEYDRVGRVVVPGTTVSTTTGTTDIRVLFENPDRLIMPGQFLRVAATLGATRAILVPQGATSRASDGTLTAYVVRDGKAKQVELNESGSYENSWIVTEGIEAGDQVIVDNLLNIQDGAEVEPVPVTISADGVVEDQVGSADADAGSGDALPEAIDESPGTPSPAAPAGAE